MSTYQTRYPLEVQLTNGQAITLNSNDNKERPLITEVALSEKSLRDAFSKNGFESVLIMEEVKQQQIGSGMRKHLSTDWDMHVRFLNLHQGLIAIDAEVETNMNYVEHLTTDNWVSVIYEVWEVIKQLTNQIYLFHKKTGLYVTNILRDFSIALAKLKEQTEWKPILAIGILALAGISLITLASSKE